MQFYLRVGNIMVINNVSDWFQFVPLQLLSDTIEHTLHSVGGKNVFKVTKNYCVLQVSELSFLYKLMW